MFSKAFQASRQRARFLLLSLAVGSAPMLATAADENAEVLAAIKFPPVKTLTDKLMGIARQVMPGQQTEMYPMLFLGAFGYPSFPGVSQTEPVTVFIFDSTETQPMPFVILSKIGPDAPLRTALTTKADPSNPMAAMMAPGFSVEDRDGFSLFTNDPANFEMVKDVSALAKMSGEVEDFDITARFFIGPEKMKTWATALKDKITEEHTLAGGAASDTTLKQKLLYIDFLTTIGENLDFYDFGMVLNNETVGLGNAIQAIKGTPEYTMLSAKSGGAVPVAQFVDASAAVTYAGNFDVDAVEAYYEVLEKRALAIANEEGKAIIKKAGKANREYFAEAGNTSAGSLSFSGEDPVSASITSGKFTNDSVVSISKLYYDDILPTVLAHLSGLDVADQDSVKFELREKVGTVGKAVINEVISRIKIVEPALPGQDDAEPVTEVETESTFFAVVAGNVITATSQSLLSQLAASVGSGKPVENNVASMIELADGEAAAYQVNFTPLIEMLADSYPMESQVAKQTYKSLLAADLAPAGGKITLGAGKGKAVFNAPVSSLVKLNDARTQIEQSELEAQTFGPDESN